MNEPQLRSAGAGAVYPPGSGAPEVGGPGRRHVRWEGWVGLGAVLMTITGGFAVVQGLVALSSPTFFLTGGGRVLALDLAGWGWLHLLLGILVAAAGLGVLGGARWARSAGVTLVAITMLVQLVWLPAFPLWSIITIALDLLIIYAIATTWEDWRVGR